MHSFGVRYAGGSGPVKLLLVVVVVVAVVLLIYLVIRASDDGASERDTPDVALVKRNLPSYARAQHARAERLERLLCEVKAEDEVLPALSAALRDRIAAELRRGDG